MYAYFTIHSNWSFCVTLKLLTFWQGRSAYCIFCKFKKKSYSSEKIPPPPMHTFQAFKWKTHQTVFVLVGTNLVLVTLSSAWDFWPFHHPAHVVRSKRVTAGLCLLECTETTGQLYQHTGLLSFAAVTLMCSDTTTARCLSIYISSTNSQ